MFETVTNSVTDIKQQTEKQIQKPEYTKDLFKKIWLDKYQRLLRSSSIKVR